MVNKASSFETSLLQNIGLNQHNTYSIKFSATGRHGTYINPAKQADVASEVPVNQKCLQQRKIYLLTSSIFNLHYRLYYTK